MYLCNTLSMCTTTHTLLLYSRARSMSMLAPESRLLSTVDPALSLLEAVGTPRSEALLSIAATLRSRLLAHLPSMPSHRREELLLLTIRTECWWDAAELLPVVAGLIEHSITLPPPLLHALAGPQRAALTPLTPGAHRKLAELATDTFGNDLFGPHILEFTDGSRWRSLLDDTLGRPPQLPPPPPSPGQRCEQRARRRRQLAATPGPWRPLAPVRPPERVR